MSSVFGTTKDGQDQKKDLLDESANTIETGIPGFDETLGSGLPAGNLYLISGQIGSGSNLMAQQMLYHIIVKKGKVTYYTVENPSTDIIEDMKLFGMKIQEYVDDGTWIFARVLPSNIKKVADALPDIPMEKRIELVDSLSKLKSHFHDTVKEGRNTVLHMSHLIRSFPLEEIQNMLFFMEGVARKYGGIHFILMTEGSHDNSIALAVKDAVDSIFEITSEIRGTETQNTVTVQKIRNLVPKTRTIRLTVKNTGLVTDTIRRM